MLIDSKPIAMRLAVPRSSLHVNHWHIGVMWCSFMYPYLWVALYKKFLGKGWLSFHTEGFVVLVWFQSQAKQS